ncbi:MAG: hypothetical protein IPM39_29440 [Chloroflexi bacterium]|nr:hypothetical protein [Chloroflexota bacterium]
MNETTNADGYLENRLSERMQVSWRSAVPEYTAMVFRYSFLFGAGMWALIYLMPSGAGGIQFYGWRVWLWLVISSIMAGLVAAGFAASLATVVKDWFYPYSTPYSTTRSLPRTAAPADAKPRSLARVMENGSIFYGMEKLEPERWLALARALVERGERQISRRKLAEWGVVDDRLGPVAKQFIVDLNTLKYVQGRGNDLYEASEDLVNYVADMFPAMRPGQMPLPLP